LAEKTGLPYALPTEAQWEYAARSRGEGVRYATHDGMTLVLDDYMLGEHFSGDPIKNKTVIRNAHDPLAIPKGNAYGITVNEYEWYTRIVGSYPSNKLGIYDMTGNAQEWVRDWYEKDHYIKMDEVNPQGPLEPKKWLETYDKELIPTKVKRDWVTSSSTAGTSRGTIYGRGRSNVRSDINGFRCALNSPEPIR
jgi:formylglycine-generating enzyme required for sulfatase activity